MSSIVKGKSINASKVAFSAPRVLDSGAKLVYVNYNSGRFFMQTPWMSLPWEMKTYEEGDIKKYTLTLSFRGYDENPELMQFHDKMSELEEKIIQGGVDNSVAWFKKKNLTKDTVDALFNRMIKVSTDKETGEPDGKWPPSMRAKVPYRDGKFECDISTFVEIVDGKEKWRPMKINDPESNDNIDEIFVKGAQVQCLLQCVGLWISSGNYMCQWKVSKAKVKVPESSGNVDFLEESDGEEETSTTTTTTTTTETTNPAFIEDSEEETEVVEAEPEPQPEPEPEPAPKPKKTNRKLKKPSKK